MSRGASRGPAKRVQLPSPGVNFAPDFAARAGSLVARLGGRAMRREGAGRGALLGTGEEFVGYRPYSPGEDLRRLDWTLLARHDQPFVRVHRREASESWSVLVDTSASMGVGVPGKLQLAAEVAAAITCAGHRAGARVTLLTSSDDRAMTVAPSRGALPSALSFLEESCASGERGVGELLDPSRLAGAGRVFVVSDLLDLDPAELARVVRPGREIVLVRILAPEELVPPDDEVVEWVDAETGDAFRAPVARLRGAYEEALGDELERWREIAARHRVPHVVFASDRRFEEVAQEVLTS